MNRSSRVSYHPAVFAAGVAAAALAVAGCGPHSHSSSAGSSSSGSAASAQATASASSAAGTSGSGLASASALFPAQVGDTWVYTEQLVDGTGTGTNRIAAVTPVAGGEQVAMTVSSQLPGQPASKPGTVDLVFHSDGSISYPLAQLGTTQVTIKSGSILWPSSAQLASGQPYTDTLVMSFSVAGQPTTVSANVVVKGAGSQSVTVPAGTYQTTLIDETLSEKVEGVAVNTEIQTWDASGVGPVKTEVNSTTDGKTSTLSTDELTSFTKG